MRDLLILVPDKNTEYLIGAALRRHTSLGIRAIDFSIIVEPGRDGGVRTRGAQVLKIERNRYAHAAIVLDYEGCGANISPTALEAELDAKLGVDWDCDAKAIVIVPEVDTWLWGADSHLRDVLGWPSAVPIREWLASIGVVFSDTGKPLRPKEAFERVCEEIGLPRSSRHYEAIAARLSLVRCHDPAFHRLRDAIRMWFAV